MPVFILIGLGSMFAGVCFFRLREKKCLSSGRGCWPWVSFCGALPRQLPIFARISKSLQRGFFDRGCFAILHRCQHGCACPGGSALQRRTGHAEIIAVRSEKEALQVKILTAEEQCRNLYDQVRLSEGVQKAYDELAPNPAGGGATGTPPRLGPDGQRHCA